MAVFAALNQLRWGVAGRHSRPSGADEFNARALQSLAVGDRITVDGQGLALTATSFNGLCGDPCQFVASGGTHGRNTPAYGSAEGGAIYAAQNSDFSAISCSFTGNGGQRWGRGGAVCLATGSRFSVSDSEFVDNVASRGSAIYVYSGTVLQANTTVFLSTGSQSTAILGDDIGVRTIQLSSCRIENHRSAAIRMMPLSIITVEDTEFVDNGCGGLQHNCFMNQGCTLNILWGAQLTIRDSRFRRTRSDCRQANGGLGLHIWSNQPETIYVYNTSFEPFTVLEGDSVNLIGALGDCSTVRPCSPGLGCSYSQYSLLCTPCPMGTASPAGMACAPCGAGAGPNGNQTACETCPDGTFSTVGVCQDCEFVVNADRTACAPPFQCLPGTACPSGSACAQTNDCEACAPGSVSLGGEPCTACLEQGKVNNTRQSVCEACGPGMQPTEERSACVPCSGSLYSTFGIQCIQCEGGTPDEAGTKCVQCPAKQEPDQTGKACVRLQLTLPPLRQHGDALRLQALC